MTASRPQAARTLCEAIASGASLALPITDIDLSHNEMGDRAIGAISQTIATLPHGLRKLDLWGCAASAKACMGLVGAIGHAKHTGQVLHESPIGSPIQT